MLCRNHILFFPLIAVPGFDVCLVFLRFSIFSRPCLYPSKAFPKLNHWIIWILFLMHKLFLNGFDIKIFLIKRILINVIWSKLNYLFNLTTYKRCNYLYLPHLVHWSILHWRIREARVEGMWWVATKLISIIDNL